MGFNPENTFIFTDFEYVGGAFYRNMIRIQRYSSTNLLHLADFLLHHRRFTFTLSYRAEKESATFAVLVTVMKCKVEIYIRI